MPQFLPNGTVKILKDVKWSNDYRDTRYFANINEQLSYFNSKPVLYQSENNSYVRHTLSYVAVDMNIEQLWDADYLMYQNKTMGDKWFYAFIVNLEMKAASTTWVYFEIDVIQTWLFDANPIQAFIERRHFGLETKGQLFFAPENIGTGDAYVTVAEELVDSSNLSNSAFLILSTVSLALSGGSFDDPELVGASGSLINNLPSGCNYYVIGGVSGGDITDLFEALQEYPWISKGIIGVTLLPKALLTGFTYVTEPLLNSGKTIDRIKSGSSPEVKLVFLQNIFDNFRTVKFQKLLMYPFSYVELSTQNGSVLTIYPQYCNNGDLSIRRTGIISPSPEIKYYLTGYEGLGEGYDASLTVRDFPSFPVQDTSYLMTWAKYQQEYNIDTVSLIGKFALNTITNPAPILPNAVSALTQASKMRLDFNYADTTPPSLGTQQGGSALNFATNKMGLVIRWKMIHPKTEKIISDYFNLFGYSCKEVEVIKPNRMSRFDYVETRDCHVVGSIPNDAIKKIESIYDSGLRFWHDDNIGDYDNNVGVRA